jgi:UDP-N-acetylmuramate--alanine ligase
MHVYFSGIGGAAISAAAQLAHQAGLVVSGSDKQDGTYIHTLQELGITDIQIDQSYQAIANAHAKNPIDWFVYSSAITMEHDNPPELVFCKEHGIRTSKRDDFLNMLLEKKQQKLIAFAGTHGKSTTTAMAVWLFKELGLPLSYATGAKIPFGPLATFNEKSEYFVYECDEFDRNFLAFKPAVSAITGLSWDHHEIFPTRDNYNQAFRDFMNQSQQVIIWQHDLEYVGLPAAPNIQVLDRSDPTIGTITLPGQFNREDAWLAVQTIAAHTNTAINDLVAIINRFPGLKQRMELLAPNLYTNYAHTPEKIKGGLSTAFEIAAAQKQELVVIYEPLTNRRQHYIKDDYKDVFAGAAKLYWIPSYLAREDPSLPLLTPAELITYISNPEIAEPAELDDKLLAQIREHLEQGDLVVAMGASGTGSMDDWLRKNFAGAVH